MNCRSCGSGNRREFGGVFPKLVVCLDCGDAQLRWEKRESLFGATAAIRDVGENITRQSGTTNQLPRKTTAFTAVSSSSHS
jgi:hypothetical protein